MPGAVSHGHLFRFIMLPRFLRRCCKALTVVCWCLLFSTGCATHPWRTGTGGAVLDESDYEFSKALAHFSQGLIFESEYPKDFGRALVEFESACKFDPGNQRPYGKVAVDALCLRLPDKAIEVLEKACTINPDASQPWIDLASTCQMCGRSELAIKHYQTALNLAPTNTLVRLELARIYFKSKRDDKALKILKQGLRIPDSPRLILAFAYGIGHEFIENKDISRAIPCLQFVADNLSSQRQEFCYRLGELYEALGQEKEALHNFVLATKEDPPLPDSFVRLAGIYLQTDRSKAIETLLNADRRIPDNPAILFSLAYIYSLEKQYENAVQTFKRVCDITDRSGQKISDGLYFYYGAAYERMGQFKKAEEIFEECISLYPDAHEVLNYLAYMWADKGENLEKALEYVNRALDLEPENGAYIDTLGWIYYKQKEYSKALDQIQKANELIKDDPTVNEHLGDIFQALNDNEKALSCWKQSFMLDPENETVAQKLHAQGLNVDALRKEAAKAAKQPRKVEE
jgi:tetratricopeptide (TPR) repeat protein